VTSPFAISSMYIKSEWQETSQSSPCVY